MVERRAQQQNKTRFCKDVAGLLGSAINCCTLRSITRSDSCRERHPLCSLVLFCVSDMSTAKSPSQGRSRGQAHQNTRAFRHNKNSRKTEAILSTVNTGGLCSRCSEKIEWRLRVRAAHFNHFIGDTCFKPCRWNYVAKTTNTVNFYVICSFSPNSAQFRKYKPLSQPRKCNECHQKTIKAAYRTLCVECAKRLKACPQCAEQHLNLNPKIPTKADEAQDHTFLEGVVESLRERDRRTVYRKISRGEDVLGHLVESDSDSHDDQSVDDNEENSKWNDSLGRELCREREPELLQPSRHWAVEPIRACLDISDWQKQGVRCFHQMQRATSCPVFFINRIPWIQLL